MKCYEIAIKYSKHTIETVAINSPERVFELMKNITHFQENINYMEMAYAIYLDNGCNVLGVHRISEGNVNSCHMDTRKVFQGAILANASAFILVHNHPSGNLQFSAQDKKVYKEFESKGELMEIKLMDFLIITANDFTTLKQY